jgi:2-oxoglutarate dehydrogenase E1 component
MERFSYISNADPDYIEGLYESYKKDRNSVDESWKKFFEGFEFCGATEAKVAETPKSVQKEIKVLNLIQDYRARGHFFTKTNPVRERRKYYPTLDLKNFDLDEGDLDTVFQAGSEIGIGPACLRDIISHLQQTYCKSIGAEYMFIRVREKLEWLQKRMESTKNTPDFSIEDKKSILHKLTQAVLFENFVHTKFLGQKRFALSGGETLIPGMDAIIEKGSELGVEEFVIGMAHRGRLNVLANILNKSYGYIFREFEGDAYDDSIFEGDVKYHLGFSSDLITRNGKQVHLNLASNPSHLEAVDPVVEGITRAKIDKRYDGDHNKIVPILIHGDAAIAGQGIVYEVVQMSLLEGYKTGGTIHLVINNQVGFTTNYLDGRSSIYCTDVAKITHSPVFHVNADDVESVVFAVQMAMEYRQKFHTDVFIDLLGYRKYGHNEADDPRFTQPRLYKAITQHPDPREIYCRQLEESGAIDSQQVAELEKDFQRQLQALLAEAKEKRVAPEISIFEKDWHGFRDAEDKDFERSPDTSVDEKTLLEVGEQIVTIPERIKVFDKIERLYKEKGKRFLADRTCDWAWGELLAYGTLVNEGVPIRLSGQDSERGTFAHRHAVLKSVDAEERYVPLDHIHENQALFQIFNSPLSEYGVLGFEFGYCLANPTGLTIWEAQFGDFANGAQIIIDQFLTSSEAKWQRMNGLVLFLPHGYEGQGPEHSSARLERFLAAGAANNLQVVNCTTPANFFHVLRRQTKFPFRIPLVCMTPKSLLRHPLCVSPFEDFTRKRFQEVIDDENADAREVEKVLFCSGKIYYELLERQRAGEREDIAIVRLEQLFPFPSKQMNAIVKKYRSAKRFVWVQEEAENMGAWTHLRNNFDVVRLDRICRKASATPATGFHRHHVAEQQAILDFAFEKAPQNGKKVMVAAV